MEGTKRFSLVWTDFVKEGNRLAQKVEQIREEPPTERTARMLEYYDNRLLINDTFKRQLLFRRVVTRSSDGVDPSASTDSDQKRTSASLEITPT